ncbi:hypothetical protein [Silvanigrella sp.]|jgi:hypothetical protein|uniref:hypothetical protein n=1 Tax=Silvanigrella sp. TaxID=2024976 RepID=UPI0037C587D3|nr:hypothetical protein [Silvanigrellaceae bacterium]
MLPNDPKFENSKENWKDQVKNHYNQVSLSSDQKRLLEHMLLNKAQKEKNLYFNNLIQKFKNVYHKNEKKVFSHFITAAVAATVTFGLLHVFENSNYDFISEMVSSMQDANAMPPDFDLVGDSNALPQLSMDSLPDQSFEPVIPKQLAQSYSAYEGRFFLYKGQQGVSITMEPNQNIQKTKLLQSKPSVLYIVKLTKKNENSFPKQKILKKIQAASSKIRRVYAWRDGAYGYAMVQPQGIQENNNLEENVLSNEEQPNVTAN